MKTPLRETYLMKIPYFEFLFSSRFEGYSKDFVNNFNQILNTDPNENLLSFLELSEYLEDVTNKIITYNLGLFYFQYQTFSHPFFTFSNTSAAKISSICFLESDTLISFLSISALPALKSV